MNVLLTDWTIGPRHLLHTLVSVLEVVGQTHVTFVAVEVVLPPSDLFGNILGYYDGAPGVGHKTGYSRYL